MAGSYKPKMPMARAGLMVGVALLFDVLTGVFSLLFLFAPVILCAVAGLYAQQATSAYVGQTLSTWLGYGACAVTGLTAAAVEWLTGFGLLAVQALGSFLADAIALVAWVVFSVWFMMAGVKLFGAGKQNRRFFATMGTMVAKLIPFSSALPWITIGVTMNVMLVRKEDRERKKEWEREQQALQQSQQEQRQQAYEYAMQRAYAEQETAQSIAEDVTASNATPNEAVGENPAPNAPPIPQDVRMKTAADFTREQMPPLAANENARVPIKRAA